MAHQAIRQLKRPDMPVAFVLDDAIKIRSGKKMPGVSSHFDHTTGRHVMGQQVLTLGLSCAEGFLKEQARHYASYIALIHLTAI